MAIGTARQANVATDEIFESAILTRSKNFILIHNHPSGKAEPSEDDKELMNTLIKQAPVMRKHFLDFIIVGDDTYWSMCKVLDGGEYSLQ